MYPNNQSIEIFGQNVSWPGMGPDGRFTNGDFNDPLVTPSKIPAETLNLILDNLNALITKLGGTPANIGYDQLSDLFSAAAVAKRAIMRDENGRAKIAPRPDNINADENDIARWGEVVNLREEQDARLNALEGRGGPLPAHDFGTETPTQQALIQYACESIWGGGGIFSWNAATPSGSIYTVNGAEHTALEIFNSTWVRNTYSQINHRLVLTNTPNTNPPVFVWEDVGVDTVGFASNERAGIVKGGSSIKANPANGQIEVVSYGQLFGGGRNLQVVLGVSSVQAAMAILHSKCNGDGIPDFWDLCIGDYLVIPTLVVNGTLYPNVRILVSGFNHYKNMAQSVANQNKKNHILFTFDKIVMQKRMNSSNTNTGGYPASELRAFLEGASGDGSGLFATGLKASIGDYLYTVKRNISIKNSMAWGNFTLFPPSLLEVGTTQYWDSNGDRPGDEDDTEQLHKKFPIYMVREARKRFLGQPADYDSWYWVSTPYAKDTASFCAIAHAGISYYYYASVATGGVAPAFCVA
jgi:hypothetical protein